LLKWIKKIMGIDAVSREEYNKLLDTVRDLELEVINLSSFMEKQSQLLAAIARVQADVATTVADYGMLISKDDIEESISSGRIVMSIPFDDDDLLN